MVQLGAGTSAGSLFPFLLFQLSLASVATAMLLQDACFLFLLPFCIAARPLPGFQLEFCLVSVGILSIP